GTININTLNPNFSTGSVFNTITNVRDIYYFVAYDSTNGFELWRSDGTASGTFMTRNINTGVASSSPSQFIALNDDVFFTANDVKHGREIWYTNSTTNSTYLLADLNGGGNPDYNYNSTVLEMIDHNNMIIAMVSGELLKFNKSTPPIKIYNHHGYDPSQKPEFIKYDNKLFYKGYVNNGFELFSTDGTTASLVIDLETAYGGANPTNFYVFNGFLYFTTHNYTKIWKTNGTSVGTVLVKQFLTGSIKSKFHSLNGYLFFSCQETNTGTELWKTDGTETGTTIVIDIFPGQQNSAGVSGLFIYNNLLYFSAYNGTRRYLYKTDGTSNNTVIFSSVFYYNTPIVFKNKLYFFSIENNNENYFLWTTDGINPPSKIKEFLKTNLQMEQIQLINVKDRYLVFNILPNQSIHEFWISDGTSENTKKTKIVRNKKIKEEYTNIQEYFLLNDKLYFAINDGIKGNELWIWDFDCKEFVEQIDPINSDLELTASNYINSNSLINNNLKVSFNANNYVLLTPGFETKSGTSFIANMNGCIYFPPNPPLLNVPTSPKNK
ncbi:MAG: ELWxxDGT repeat protein, partial [Leadbetterella sp.]